ncbi:monovalent cation:proton antiporter-2 (CPA2) family protein [Hydrogenophaga sp.]|uniref:monovalent cation:proton antiporter-2 (CPA2) family protein n=1 Tax=Hydrogenophaga sp. TaxID=1904254 RepID=UPI0027314B22|nr:monovalent cation:proton antiporter-2 (CPA2) family protein [Hydrogenophaga sp.]MDP2018506.1 monovalent cation:proton antiporter-2 (CPA2) family protein [Hydrogenophaga sp.]MDP3164993.1 monovalent cation:proton antiporter-2 (CPA2) family protein [Hydrogenophaga sp.]MDP3810393.1 monovalent cation:proton antiporter-2 (CPA2) family protein [Hydrogenophaga sp.]
MAVEGSAGDLLKVVTLLGAAVVAVPLFKRLGLGSVLGYLAAGLAIGPFGMGLISDPATILHTAELGVVMYLFVIGLEMQPSHLWSLRRAIFGLGSLQVVVCGLLLTGVGLAFGFPLGVSFVSAMGFVLTSTAVVMQLLGERGDMAQPRGQKIVAILLFEDLLIVPLLAVVTFMAQPDLAGPVAATSQRWATIGLALGSLVALVAAGVWLLNPLFRVLANAKAREVMTAAALLVVLGAALLMQVGGLSMAMGAFLAGVLLSESTFRHQLEADIEPFRGLLLGLFFLSVGMSLDLAAVARNWPLIVAGVVAMMLVKALCIYGVARFARSSHADALDRAVLMAQGGEFAFVLFAAALGAKVIDPVVNANMTAIVVLSMALTPLVVLVHRRLAAKPGVSMEGIEAVNGQAGSVLVIGFGRFGQIASQGVIARGASITIIDNNVQMIRDAEAYGFKVYYGDGCRADVLHAAGAHSASAILVCLDNKEAATRIAGLAKTDFPQAELLVRAFDREHVLELRKADVGYLVRETFESAMAMGRQAVLTLGAAEEEADEVMEHLRRRDAERMDLEAAGGLFAGRSLVLGRQVKKADAHPEAQTPA